MKFSRSVGKFVNAVTHPGDYVKAEVNKAVWNAQQKLTEVMVQLIIFAVIALVAFVTILFASVTLALWINQLLESSFLGFLMLTGIYFILFMLLFLVRDNDNIKNKLNGLLQNITRPESKASSEKTQEQDIIGGDYTKKAVIPPES